MSPPTWMSPLVLASVAAPVALSAPCRSMLPTVEMLPPSWVAPAPVRVRLASTLLPPRMASPPVSSVSARAVPSLSTVPARLMVWLPLLVIATSAPSLTLPDRPMAPLVVTLPLSTVLPVPRVCSEDSAVAPPTAPPKVLVPVVLTVSTCAPSTVPLKDTAPPDALDSILLLPSVTGPV